MSKVMIIGGGAAGMMAAIAAAYNGNDVTLFEKNEKLGKKIFITGKGRCNVTNASDIENHFKNIINNSKFLYSAYSTFDSEAVMNLIESAGKINQSVYTDETVNTLNQAKEEAEETIQGKPNQEEVEDSYLNLVNAIQSLQKK